MAKKNDTRFFENKLLDFVAAKDPLLEMLQWMMDKFMEIEVAARLRLIWSAPDEKSARDMKSAFCQEYEKSFPKAVECLEEGFEDSVQFYAFEELDGRKISSTNTLERLNREIRRRSSVVGIFPSTDSYIRLITSYLLEYSDDWQTERCYMNAGSIKLQKEILFDAA